jgi:hypothetical protein
LAALLLRAGQADEAAGRLRKLLPSVQEQSRALAWLYLALAESGGRPDEARRWLKTAADWMDRPGTVMPGNWQDRLELRMLREEVEKALLPAP